jgi:hypothetical protein
MSRTILVDRIDRIYDRDVIYAKSNVARARRGRGAPGGPSRIWGGRGAVLRRSRTASASSLDTRTPPPTMPPTGRSVLRRVASSPTEVSHLTRRLTLSVSKSIVAFVSFRSRDPGWGSWGFAIKYSVII